MNIDIVTTLVAIWNTSTLVQSVDGRALECSKHVQVISAGSLVKGRSVTDDLSNYAKRL